MSEKETADTTPVKYSPIAAESIAILRVLKEYAEEGDPQNMGPTILGGLWVPIGKYLAKHGPELDDAKSSEEQKEEMAVILAAVVLGGYFAHQGNFREILKPLEAAYASTHSEVPEGTREAIIAKVTKALRKHIKEAQEEK